MGLDARCKESLFLCSSFAGWWMAIEMWISLEGSVLWLGIFLQVYTKDQCQLTCLSLILLGKWECA